MIQLCKNCKVEKTDNRSKFCSDWCKETNEPYLHFCKVCNIGVRAFKRTNGFSSGVFPKMCVTCRNKRKIFCIYCKQLRFKTKFRGKKCLVCLFQYQKEYRAKRKLSTGIM